MDWIINFDKELLLTLNGIHTPFFDYFMFTISGKEVWLLLYLTIIAVIGNKYGWKQGGAIVLAMILTIVLSDQITSGIMKPFFERFRPSRDPDLSNLVHIVNNYRGGKYGFASSHAANTFALAVFSILFFKHKPLAVFMLFWAVMVSYSRIYLGVHYTGDILVGAIIGATVGAVIYGVYRKYIEPKFNEQVTEKCTMLTTNSIVVIGVTIFLTLLLAAKTMI